MMIALLAVLGCKAPVDPGVVAEGTAPQAATALPSVASLFDIFLKQGAMPEHEARHIVSLVKMPAQGIEARASVWQTREQDRYLNVTTIAGIGEIVRAWDGEVGWTLNPMTGPRLLEGDELKTLIFNASFEGDKNWRERYTGLEVVGQEDFNGMPTWKVQGQIAALQTPITFWFDVAEGRMQGMALSMVMAMGSMKTQMAFKEYTDQGGFLMPQVTEMVTMGMPQTVILEQINFDPEDMPEIAPPDVIRDLME